MEPHHQSVEIIMALTSEESQQLGRIEANVEHIKDTLHTHIEDETPRLVKLEHGVSWTKGVLALLSVIFTLGCAFIISGCAHMSEETFYPNGATKGFLSSTVLGTGETTLIIECNDGEHYYTTRDTGISDNAVRAAEAAVTATPPGAAASALGEILERIGDE
jgi:hypothetical protein